MKIRAQRLDQGSVSSEGTFQGCGQLPGWQLPRLKLPESGVLVPAGGGDLVGRIRVPHVVTQNFLPSGAQAAVPEFFSQSYLRNR